jgi:hypothetical protein
MSGVVDVGDAVELTFTGVPGAEVTVSWLDPNQTVVIDAAVVAETPPGSGLFPTTLLATTAGSWTAVFTSSGAAVGVERYYVRATSSTMVPLASVGDVAAQFGALTTAQEQLTAWLVRAASAMVRYRFPLVDTHISAGLLDPDVVALTIANMILRVLRNPGGLRSETIGPFSRAFDTRYAAGLLVITDEEAAMFTPIAAAQVYAIGTIPLGVALCPPQRSGYGRW